MQFIRESIFASTLRLFCKTAALIVGIATGLLLSALAIAAFATPAYFPPTSQMTMIPDGEGNRTVLPSTAPVILAIDIQGVIGLGDLTADKISNLLLDSRENLLKNDRVKGILLQINTPGGSSVDSDTIYQTLMSYKAKYDVPVYAYVNGLCASGGMYIACAADKIYASRSSTIGSVGVILGPNFNFYGTMNRYGIESKTLTAGQNKDELNPFRQWKPDEGQSLESIISVIYNQFIDTVSLSRPLLTKEKLMQDYGANVFAAPTALQLGYIDVSDSSYNQVMKDLAKAAGIQEDTAYQVVRLTPTRPFFNEFTQSISPSHIIQSLLKPSLSDLCQLEGQFLYYYQP